MRKNGKWSFKSIAEHLGVDSRTVSKVWKRYLKTVSKEKKPIRCNHYRKTTPEEDKKIFKFALENPLASSNEICQVLNIQTHPSTVRRRLLEMNFRCGHLYSEYVTVKYRFLEKT